MKIGMAFLKAGSRDPAFQSPNHLAALHGDLFPGWLSPLDRASMRISKWKTGGMMNESRVTLILP
jgi:hypothetical protein